MKRHRQYGFAWSWKTIALAALMTTVLAGCGGRENLGSVSGQVKLGDQPLAGALIRFQPQQPGSPSSAISDESGYYTLTYTRDLRGAEIGTHRVTISTFSRGNPDGEPPAPPVPERVPAKYNTASQLTAEVKQGSNEIDFQLESTAPVVQPTSAED
ncbi:MAG: carboxypeptidase-like regulatory domain-containing protein [Pirellulales bacterium]